MSVILLIAMLTAARHALASRRLRRAVVCGVTLAFLAAAQPRARAADNLNVLGGGGGGGGDYGIGAIGTASVGGSPGGGNGLTKPDASGTGGGGGGGFAGSTAYDTTYAGYDGSQDAGGGGGGNGDWRGGNGGDNSLRGDSSASLAGYDSGGAGGTSTTGGNGGGGGGLGGPGKAATGGGGSGGGGGGNIEHWINDSEFRTVIVSGGNGGQGGFAGGGGGGTAVMHGDDIKYSISSMTVTGGKGGDGGGGEQISQPDPVTGETTVIKHGGGGGGGGGNGIVHNKAATLAIASTLSLTGGDGSSTPLGGAGGNAIMINDTVNLTVGGNVTLRGANGFDFSNGGYVKVEESGSTTVVGGSLTIRGGDGGDGAGTSGGGASWTGSKNNLTVAGNVNVLGGDGGVYGAGGGAAALAADTLAIAKTRALTATSGVHNAAAAGGDVDISVGELTTGALNLTRQDGALDTSVSLLHVSGSTSILLDNTLAESTLIRTMSFAGGDRLAIQYQNGGAMYFDSIAVAGINNNYSGNYRLDASGRSMVFDLTGVNAGDAMLSVTDSNLMNIDGTTAISLDITGDQMLETGESIILVRNTDGAYSDRLTAGFGSKEYNYLLELSSSTNRNLLLTLDSRSLVQDKARNYFIGATARTALLTTGSDLLVMDAIPTAMGASSTNPTCAKPTIFAAASYADQRFDTGSHLDTRNVNAVIGVAFRKEMASSALVAAPFIEGGLGKYDAVNHYNGARLSSDGDAYNYGGGLFARWQTDSGFYIDLSARGGQIHSDYNSRDLGVGTTEYESSTWYAGGHAGLGMECRYNECSSLTGYAFVSALHQNADKASNNMDEFIDFDAARSLRTRLGIRHNFTPNDGATIYAGAAWDHEFDGEVTGKIDGIKLTKPASIKGDSAMVEAGVKWRDISDGWELDLAARGMFGQRLGYSASVAFGKMF